MERLPAEAHGVLTDDRPDRMSIEETFGDDEADVPAGRYFRHHGGVVGGLVQGQPRAERARFEFPSKDVVAPRVFEQRRWFGARHMCDELCSSTVGHRQRGVADVAEVTVRAERGPLG